MDKLISMEIPWLVTFTISAALWIIGILAKMVFDACLKAIEPREAVARILAILRDPTQFVIDDYGDAIHLSTNAKLREETATSFSYLLIDGKTVHDGFTKRECRAIGTAARKVFKHLHNQAALKRLTEAGV